MGVIDTYCEIDINIGNNYKHPLTGLLQEFIWGSICVFVFFYKTT